MKYPRYEKLEGFTASDGFKEITAREFEEVRAASAPPARISGTLATELVCPALLPLCQVST